MKMPPPFFKVHHPACSIDRELLEILPGAQVCFWNASFIYLIYGLSVVSIADLFNRPDKMGINVCALWVF